MKLKLTPTALALASTTSIFVQSSSISNAGEVRLSHRPKDITDKIKYRRRAERKPILGISTGGGNAEVDVGILAGDDGHRQHDAIPLFGRTRFLQEDQPTCSYPDTCEPNLCACTAKGQYAYDCAAELNAVCNKVYDANGKVWTLDGCTGDVEYYANTYCPFVKCIVEGGTYGACSCQFYQTVCNLYGDRQKYEDDPNTIQSCAAASCCQDKVDEDGRNSCFDSARLSTMSTTSASKNVTDPSPVVEQTTSSGHSLMSWNNLRATSSLTATAVAWSILC